MFAALVQECREAISEHYSPGDKLRYKARFGDVVRARRRQSLQRALRGKRPKDLDEYALNPDLHRDSVKALLRDTGGVGPRPPIEFQKIPALKAPRHRRGRNPKKAQVQGSSGYKDVEEYGSPGRQFGDTF